MYEFMEGLEGTHKYFFYVNNNFFLNDRIIKVKIRVNKKRKDKKPL